MVFTPKPPTSVRSIRLPDETWAWLGQEAERRGLSVNALVSDFILVARLKVAEAKAAPRKAAAKPQNAPASKVAPRISVSVPYAGDVRRAPMQKTPKR